MRSFERAAVLEAKRQAATANASAAPSPAPSPKAEKPSAPVQEGSNAWFADKIEAAKKGYIGASSRRAKAESVKDWSLLALEMAKPANSTVDYTAKIQALFLEHGNETNSFGPGLLRVLGSEEGISAHDPIATAFVIFEKLHPQKAPSSPIAPTEKVKKALSIKTMREEAQQLNSKTERLRAAIDLARIQLSDPDTTRLETINLNENTNTSQISAPAEPNPVKQFAALDAGTLFAKYDAADKPRRELGSKIQACDAQLKTIKPRLQSKRAAKALDLVVLDVETVEPLVDLEGNSEETLQTNVASLEQQRAQLVAEYKALAPSFPSDASETGPALSDLLSGIYRFVLNDAHTVGVVDSNNNRLDPTNFRHISMAIWIKAVNRALKNSGCKDKRIINSWATLSATMSANPDQDHSAELLALLVQDNIITASIISLLLNNFGAHDFNAETRSYLKTLARRDLAQLLVDTGYSSPHHLETIATEDFETAQSELKRAGAALEEQEKAATQLNARILRKQQEQAATQALNAEANSLITQLQGSTAELNSPDRLEESQDANLINSLEAIFTKIRGLNSGVVAATSEWVKNHPRNPNNDTLNVELKKLVRAAQKKERNCLVTLSSFTTLQKTSLTLEQVTAVEQLISGFTYALIGKNAAEYKTAVEAIRSNLAEIKERLSAKKSRASSDDLTHVAAPGSPMREKRSKSESDLSRMKVGGAQNGEKSPSFTENNGGEASPRSSSASDNASRSVSPVAPVTEASAETNQEKSIRLFKAASLSAKGFDSVVENTDLFKEARALTNSADSSSVHIGKRILLRKAIELIELPRDRYGSQARIKKGFALLAVLLTAGENASVKGELSKIRLQDPLKKNGYGLFDNCGRFFGSGTKKAVEAYEKTLKAPKK